MYILFTIFLLLVKLKVYMHIGILFTWFLKARIFLSEMLIFKYFASENFLLNDAFFSNGSFVANKKQKYKDIFILCILRFSAMSV